MSENRGWHPSVTDRLVILPDGSIDELVMLNANVHLEHLGDGTYMLIVENDREHVHLTIPSRTNRQGVPKAFVYDRFERGPGRTVPDE